MQQKNYIFGFHSVMEILQKHPEKIACLYLQEGKDLYAIEKHVKNKSFKIKYLEKKALNQLTSSENTQGIVAELFGSDEPLTENDLDVILNSTKEPPFLLILDGVQDPHNLGACLRSANAAGVHAVIVPKDNAVGLTPVVHKVSSGASTSTPFVQVTNLARTMQLLKDRGIWLYGADERAEQTIYQADFKGAIALVLGAEGAGLRKLTKNSCDFLVKIPLFGTVPSLNVSVAAGICLFEAVRVRHR